jgi:glycosyltransferase involved in cell wall biosynthesis
LAHQSEIALSLANNFSKVYILTGEVNGISVPSNMQIFTYKAKINFLPFLVIKFFVLFLYLISTKNIDVVFSHMSSRHSAVMGPILKIWRKRHVLWYAHISRPFTLFLSYFFVDKLVTSTKGSCPITGAKVSYIGQSIEEKNFQMKKSNSSNLINFVHVGRFDPSKNIDLIISSFVELRKVYSEIYLTIIGNPSDNDSEDYKKLLEKKYVDCLKQGLITFKPSIKRSEMGEVLAKYDLFLHSFRGSLDKILLEATLVGLPVVTVNSEYASQLGNWCSDDSSQNDLLSQLFYLMAMPVGNRNEEIFRRRGIVLENHTLSKWVDKLTNILISN